LDWSLLHPWIVPGVGIHARAAAVDGSGSQFVVPGLVPVDLAESILRAMSGQPRRGPGWPDVDRLSRHMSRRARGGDPSRGLLLRAVLPDRLKVEPVLVLRGAPTTVDRDLDSVPCGSLCSLAERTEEIWIEVGHRRRVAIEDRQATTDGANGLAMRQPRANPMATDDGDERPADAHQDRDDGQSYTVGCCSCWLVGGHATIQDRAALPARMRFSIC
jgi:hypothetical protein